MLDELICRSEIPVDVMAEAYERAVMIAAVTDIFAVYVLFAIAVAFLAGLVKGAVGFGMPMIMMSCLTLVYPPDFALALLIVPTLVSNGIQALRQGTGPALSSVKRFGPFLLVGGVCLVLSAQLVAIWDTATLFLVIGSAVTVFAVFQLSGWRPALSPNSRTVQMAVGLFAGSIGGLSGIWGPPTVAYLTAINTPKEEQLRIQGVIYGLGAVALFCAHINSGVLTLTNGAFSAALALPAMIGVVMGYRFQSRIDQALFRKMTLVVLIFGGLNLMRRAILG